jgi:sugar lactone lactonase YvrE
LDTITGKIYWVDGYLSTASIRRANLDGTNIEDIITSWALSEPVGITLDEVEAKMYWTNYDFASIQRANLNGSNVEVLVASGLSHPGGIALDVAAGKMYWTSYGAAKIQRANLDGTDIEDIITSGLSHPEGIALDTAADKMYWIDAGTDKIQRANLDGTVVEDLVTSGLSNPFGIALDTPAGKMYWTDGGTVKIQRAYLDGTNVEDLISSGLDSPGGIALDTVAGKMYWIDSGTDKIQRANLDGNNVEDIITTGLFSPTGIALALVTNDGGLVGNDNGGSYTGCFWDGTVYSGLTGIGNIADPCGVIGESTANMQTQNTYTSAGWDFVGKTVNGPNDIWRLCEDGTDYPKLSIQFLLGDFVCPDGVDFVDYSFFSGRWGDTDCANANDCDRTDIDLSGAVDWGDVKMFCEQWLEGL